jgi:hypothetical protein
MCCLPQAVTRAKQRLYLTCPQYRCWPPPKAKPPQDQEKVNRDNVLVPSKFLGKLARLEGVMLAEETPVLCTENLMVLS